MYFRMTRLQVDMVTNAFATHRFACSCISYASDHGANCRGAFVVAVRVSEIVKYWEI